MAPRQRISSQSANEEVQSSDSSSPTTAEKRRLVSRVSSASPQNQDHDSARDSHDYFNLIALIFVIASVAVNYDWGMSIHANFLQDAWVGNYFWGMWGTSNLYFTVDLAWVTIIPICVKSPGVIVKHHIVAMLYMLAPAFFPEYRWFMGALLTVEINTWFLILRRVVFKTNTKIPLWVSNLISALFYVTWILIRCVLYPAILITFLQLAREKVEGTGSYIQPRAVFILVHCVLCALNLKWTYDLFLPLVKKWFGKDPKAVGVQNGL